MIRKFLCTILMTTIVFAGCGANKDSVEEKDKTDVVQDASATNAEESVDAQSTSEETQEDTEEEELLGVIGKITQSDKDKSGLYTAFLNNEVEATVDYEEEYNNGNSYNLEALTKEYFPDDEVDISDVKDADSIKDDNNEEGEKLGIIYKYIDCGVDGKSELLLTISPSYIVYKFVIQEKEGKLFIKYTDNTDDRGWSNISDKGYYSAEINSGDCRSYEDGFFDGDANFHRYYSRAFYFDGTSFFTDAANENGNGNVDLDSDTLENIQIDEYVFYDDVESYQNADRYYNYAVIDESTAEGWYDCDKDPGYADGSSVYMKEFEKIGVKPLPRAEIKKVLEKRAKDIGLSLDIIPEDEL